MRPVMNSRFGSQIESAHCVLSGHASSSFEIPVPAVDLESTMPEWVMRLFKSVEASSDGAATFTV
jgi:hypothetical protein